MRIYSLLCISLICLLGSTACGVRQNEAVAAGNHSTRQSPKILLRQVEASLIEKAEPPADLTESKVSGVAELIGTQFIDADNGRAADHDSIYKTTDAGHTWERFKVGLPLNSRIVSFFFVNPERGWLAAVASNEAGRYGLGYSSYLMRTDDGGKTWAVQESLGDEVNVGRIEFLDSNVGLAIGNKVIDSKPAYVEVFAAMTTDGGGTWINISDRINSVVKNEYGVATDDAVDVYRSASSRILLLTRLGRVVSSSDNGNSWRLDTQFEGENLQTGYEKIELDGGGRLKILAGQAGDEGFRGNLIVEDSEHSLTSYNIARTPLSDAVFLSDSEIIACGMELQSTQHGDSARNDQSLAGVVLHSTDGGKSWTVIYRSKSGEAFVSITSIDSHFYVIGQAGTLLKFTLDS
jgi:photosystem II stability/assembly factor-like uncharacterized protein